MHNVFWYYILGMKNLHNKFLLSCVLNCEQLNMIKYLPLFKIIIDFYIQTFTILYDKIDNDEKVSVLTLFYWY